jgi:hypothetical protein
MLQVHVTSHVSRATTSTSTWLEIAPATPAPVLCEIHIDDGHTGRVYQARLDGQCANFISVHWSTESVLQSYSPPSVGKSSDPINFGILGAAAIAPWALILPARCNPHVVIYAVAARDEARAQIFARKHGINKVYSGAEGYQRTLYFFSSGSI